MKSKIPKFFLKLFFVFLILSCPVFADTLILKNGQQIKGEIIQNDSDGVIIEYLVTPTIKDDKTFSRDEIERVISIPPDEKLFSEMGNRATPPTVLDTSFYDPLIEKKLPEFIDQYPYSRHISELREDLRSLTAERERVRGGDRRLDGTWFTAAQIAADPYQMGARVKLAEIRQLANGNNPVATLRAYELMEKSYPGSRSLPDALDLMPSQLDKLQENLSTVFANYDILSNKRQTWISSAPADLAKEMQDALDRENLTASESIAKAAKNGSKFFPVFPNVKSALDQLQALLLSERARLKTLQALPMRESLDDSSDASRLMAIGRLKEAEGQLDAASKLWPANAEVASLKQKILDAAKAAPSPSPSR